MKHLLALLLSVLLTGCGDSWVIPVVPPAPPGPVVVPVDPVDPQPVVATVVPNATVAQIVAGMDRAALLALMVVAPTLDVRQDDGTTLTRWPTLDADGGARWAVVHLDSAGHVIGLALIPRAE